MPIYRPSTIFSIISPTPKWHRREDKEGTEHLFKSNPGVWNQIKKDEYCDLGSRPYCLKKLNCKARWSNAFCDFLCMCFWYLLLPCGKPCSQRTSEQICWQVWEIGGGLEESRVTRVRYLSSPNRSIWPPTPCCWHARRCDMRCNLSRAFLGKPHNLRRDLSPNELPLPLATAWLLVRVEFLPTWRNHAKRSLNLEIWSLSSYICGGCVICQVPASDARPYLRDWEDDCMLGVEGGGAVFWAQLYNQTVINDSRPTGK